MAVAHAVAHVDEIEMGVDLDDVDRPAPGKARYTERCTAWSPPRITGSAPDPGSCARPIGVRMALHGVGVDDVGIADIDDPHLVARQIDLVVLVVVGAVMAEGEQGRGLADGARSEARAGAVLRPHVERHAEHRDIGVDVVPSQIGRLPKVQCRRRAGSAARSYPCSAIKFSPVIVFACWP